MSGGTVPGKGEGDAALVPSPLHHRVMIASHFPLISGSCSQLDPECLVFNQFSISSLRGNSSFAPFSLSSRCLLLMQLRNFCFNFESLTSCHRHG